MRTITLLQPTKTVFGTGCIEQFADDYLKLGYKRLFIVTMPVVRPAISALTDKLAANGVCIKFYEDVHGEPSIADFKVCVNACCPTTFLNVVGRYFRADTMYCSINKEIINANLSKSAFNRK